MQTVDSSIDRTMLINKVVNIIDIAIQSRLYIARATTADITALIFIILFVIAGVVWEWNVGLDAIITHKHTAW